MSRTSPLLESYRVHGFTGIQNASEEEIAEDHILNFDIIPLIIDRDDEAAFDFVLDKLWGSCRKGLIRASLQHSTTKYLSKVIALTGFMLLEEVDEGDNYSLEETCIVVRAYLKTMTFEELWALPDKGETLTEALRQMHDEV